MPLDLNSLPSGWKTFFKAEAGKPYFQAIEQRLQSEKHCPDTADILKAFSMTDIDQVAVVIVGQDPYPHQEATGLAFAVKAGCRVSTSLENILMEVERTEGTVASGQTSLEPWAKQGVLLLNSMLTAEPGAGKALSHEKWGWGSLTGAVINLLKAREQPILFLVWGKYANDIVGDVQKPHLALRTSHPSWYSVKKGFFECGHFREANVWLLAQGREPINWTQT